MSDTAGTQSATDLRLKLAPILVVALGFGLPYLAAFAAILLSR
jgi:hypothetical protein